MILVSFCTAQWKLKSCRSRCCALSLKPIPICSQPSDLSHLGLIPDNEFDWPIGFSRKRVSHLGNLPAVGINCASCHFAQISSPSTAKAIGILGVTSHFDVETFFR